MLANIKVNGSNASVYTPYKVNSIDRLNLYHDSENASHGLAAEQKKFREQTGATLFRPGTVPVPVPVLSLVESY